MDLASKIVFKYELIINNLKFEIEELKGRIRKHNPKIVGIEETINLITQKRISVSRFGDGEIRLINNESIEFQEFHPKLAEKLEIIICNQSANILICIPNVFSGLDNYTKPTKYFWKRHLNNYRKVWMSSLDVNKVYYDAFITRPYMCYSNKVTSNDTFKALKAVWKTRDILIIEGEKSRLGVGNDLFDEAQTISRILCPVKNAFSVFDDILAEAQQFPKSFLVLIALGPSATVLAYDLNLLGYQAIDIGHIDIEYEWFLMQTLSKVKIPSKYTNEAVDGMNPVDIKDSVYESQIMKKIF